MNLHCLFRDAKIGCNLLVELGQRLCDERPMLPDRQPTPRTFALAGGMAVPLILSVALLVLWHRAEDERSAATGRRAKPEPILAMFVDESKAP